MTGLYADSYDFLGFTSWPDEVVAFDLGGRALLVTGSPGRNNAYLH